MPKIELKQVKIDEIKEKLEGASSIVLVDHRGLTVEQDTELRKNLRDANVTYKVYKNSMMKFAFKGTEFDGLNEHLAGPSAIAISYDDATAGPRVLAKQAKEFENLEFKGGVVEGVLYDVDGIIAVSKVPSREELLSKLLGSFKSPISSFARTMKALADKMEEEGVETAASLVSDAKEEAPAEAEAETKEEVVEEAKEEVKEEAPVAEAKKEEE